MAVEMTLNQTTKIAVINGKAYQAYAWYTDNSKPFFLAVAGKTPLTLEDIGDEYYIVKQRPLYLAFLRSYFPFSSTLIDELRDKQPYAYTAVGLTADAVVVSFTAQMEALAANVEVSLHRANKAKDLTGTGPDALFISEWRVQRIFAQKVEESEEESESYEDLKRGLDD